MDELNAAFEGLLIGMLITIPVAVVFGSIAVRGKIRELDHDETKPTGIQSTDRPGPQGPKPPPPDIRA